MSQLRSEDEQGEINMNKQPPVKTGFTKNYTYYTCEEVYADGYTTNGDYWWIGTITGYHKIKLEQGEKVNAVNYCPNCGAKMNGGKAD